MPAIWEGLLFPFDAPCCLPRPNHVLRLSAFWLGGELTGGDKGWLPKLLSEGDLVDTEKENCRSGVLNGFSTKIIDTNLLLWPLWSHWNIFDERRCHRLWNRSGNSLCNGRTWCSWLWNMRTGWTDWRSDGGFERWRFWWLSYLCTRRSADCRHIFSVNWRLRTRSSLIIDYLSRFYSNLKYHIEDVDISSSRCSRSTWRSRIFVILIISHRFLRWHGFDTFRKYEIKILILFS